MMDDITEEQLDRFMSEASENPGKYGLYGVRLDSPLFKAYLYGRSCAEAKSKEVKK